MIRIGAIQGSGVQDPDELVRRETALLEWAKRTAGQEFDENLIERVALR